MFELFLKIIFFPIWFPFILVISILLFLCGLIFGFFAFGIFVIFATLLLISVVVIIVSIINLFNQFFTSILGFGISLILLGFALLFVIFGIFLYTKVIPSLLSGISSIFKRMFSLSKKRKTFNSETTILASNKEITEYEEIN